MQDHTPRLPLGTSGAQKKSKGGLSRRQQSKAINGFRTKPARANPTTVLDSPTASLNELPEEPSSLKLSGSGAFPFPIVGDTASNRPWRPHLVGEGEFQDGPEHDAIAQAQAALAALEEGTLRLVKLVESETNQWDRPRAA